MNMKDFSRLSQPDTATDVLELGEKRSNIMLLGKRITIRRLGCPGVTTGPSQSRYYVCNETDRTVIAGPFARKKFANDCLSLLYLRMQHELPLGANLSLSDVAKKA
tara:strand:- start:122 stop:439 length:318 start_codon:yes stop_codon:yes gene_type:complete